MSCLPACSSARLNGGARARLLRRDMVDVGRRWTEDGGAQISGSCTRVVQQITV
jgi:hypothetical protein